MRKDKMADEKSFDDQLEKTEGLFISYNEQLEVLKKLFYDKYDRSIVIGLLHLVQKNGHPIDQRQAKEFEKGYNADNVDVGGLKWFKDAYKRYNKELLGELNGREDVL